jgi:6-phosphogluconate dehydrogenase
VHNGIEYADMQMIAEVYGLMRDGQGRAAADIAARLRRWNGGPLESYLIEIAAEVAAAQDPDTGVPILDVIADRAGQKGTGRWTVIDAQRRAAPLPAVEAAVTARVLSGEARFGPKGATCSRKPGTLAPLTTPNSRRRCWPARSSPIPRGSRYCRGPGKRKLDHAARDRRPDVARGLHHPLGHARRHGERLGAGSDGPPLAFAPGFADRSEALAGPAHVSSPQRRARACRCPALSAALQHFDQLRQARGTANMIQALRDRFGAHGFERTTARARPGFTGPGSADASGGLSSPGRSGGKASIRWLSVKVGPSNRTSSRCNSLIPAQSSAS